MSSSLEASPKSSMPERGDRYISAQLDLSARFGQRTGRDREAATMYWVDADRGNYAAEYQKIYESDADLRDSLENAKTAEEYEKALVEFERRLYEDDSTDA